jgi:hypothetical protein
VKKDREPEAIKVLARSVWLIWFVLFIWLIVHLVSFVQPKKPNKQDKPKEQDRLADLFSMLLEESRPPQLQPNSDRMA